jgi:hypothetical protein
VGRDSPFGIGSLIMSAVYAHYWPDGYCDAPKAKGLPLTANILNNTSSIAEVALVLADDPSGTVFFFVAVAKVLLFSSSASATCSASPPTSSSWSTPDRPQQPGPSPAGVLPCTPRYWPPRPALT